MITDDQITTKAKEEAQRNITNYTKINLTPQENDKV
jgi:hypothetical protein